MLDQHSPLLQAAHLVGGLGAFGLGAVAALLPKSGVASRWHQRVGQGYALCMLLIAGPPTLLWVIWGRLSLPRAAVHRSGGPVSAAASRCPGPFPVRWSGP